LNEDFPRSIRFCVDALNDSLRHISGVPGGRFSNDAEKLAGRLVAELQFSTIEEIFDTGLHGYIDTIQLKLNAIGDALFNAYISHAFSPTEEEHFVQQEEQQQQVGPSIVNRKS
ncbi:MAG TPA: alpha-E domain-containing protein, partial [Candidatus Paceibacterota bacterium]|nr:alpha-E domain-containing protein [Candidatus Paceibacterota bacterium]